MIQFFNQDSLFKLDNEEFISSWILSTFQSEKINKSIELTFVFCSDAALLKINQDFLNQDYYTDIITFPIEEDDENLEAEIYISVDRVKENAENLSKTFINELHRVIIHGVLHLCGYPDKSDKEAKIMRNKEDFYLKTSGL